MDTNIEKKQTSGFAVASLVLGILSLILFVFGIMGILAIVFGSIAIGKTESEHKGRGMAIAGLIMGIISLFMTLISLIVVILLGHMFGSTLSLAMLL